MCCKLTASHKQTDAQTVSDQCLPWKTKLPSFLLLSMTSYGTDHHFVLFRSAAPLSAYSLEWEKEKQKALMLCKHCSATAKTLPCYQHHCVLKFKAWHLWVAIKKVNSTLANSCNTTADCRLHIR